MTGLIATRAADQWSLTIDRLWQAAGFAPNAAQRDAILYVDGPLYLPAGPGSGKTRVLLWRTLNLIVFHGVPPEHIFLSTFTEKAARQLKEGLRALLGLARLNVYAYIWQHLRGQRLDETAVICTQLPETLRRALGAGDERRIAYELEQWEPVIPIPFDPSRVDDMVRAFGEVVDLIEDGCFAPADLTTLHGRLPGTARTFASEVCRRCDARFSCASYRAYAHAASQGVEARFREYFDDYGDDAEQTERIASGLPDAGA